jgi:hypothetical protein
MREPGEARFLSTHPKQVIVNLADVSKEHASVMERDYAIRDTVEYKASVVVAEIATNCLAV